MKLKKLAALVNRAVFLISSTLNLLAIISFSMPIITSNSTNKTTNSPIILNMIGKID